MATSSSGGRSMPPRATRHSRGNENSFLRQSVHQSCQRKKSSLSPAKPDTSGKSTLLICSLSMSTARDRMSSETSCCHQQISERLVKKKQLTCFGSPSLFIITRHASTAKPAFLRICNLAHPSSISSSVSTCGLDSASSSSG